MTWSHSKTTVFEDFLFCCPKTPFTWGRKAKIEKQTSRLEKYQDTRGHSYNCNPISVKVFCFCFFFRLCRRYLILKLVWSVIFQLRNVSYFRGHFSSIVSNVLYSIFCLQLIFSVNAFWSSSSPHKSCKFRCSPVIFRLLHLYFVFFLFCMFSLFLFLSSNRWF